MKKAFVLCLCLLLGMSLSVGGGCSKKDKVTEPEDKAGLYDPEQGIDRSQVLEYIVKDGASAYWIVIADDAGSLEQYAAQEMQYFLAEATGVYLPVRRESLVLYSEDSRIISLGKTDILQSLNLEIDYASLNGDGFVLKTAGKSLFIDSDNLRGTLYGVYDFLEKICGVRFFSDDETLVPQTDTVPLYRMDVKEVPAFEYRGLLSDATYHIKDQAFMARSRFVHEFLPLEAQYGGSIEWFDQIDTTHNSLTYVSPAEYFATDAQKEENAHMFYILNGEVVDICYTDGIAEDGGIDESMPVSAIKAAVASLKSYILSDPDSKFFIFGQEDIRTSCDCASCRASAETYTTAGSVIRFVNALAVEIDSWLTQQQINREIEIVMFAYYFSAEPPVVVDAATGGYLPVHDSVVPADNVTIRLAPITKNHYYPVSSSVQSRVYDDWLKKWSALTDRFMVWDYYTNYDHYFAYYQTTHHWRESLNEYAGIGVRYMFMQHDPTEYHDWQAILSAYIGSKMLWNPNRNVNELRREFLEGYFGPAADEVALLMYFCDEYYAINCAATNGNFILSGLTAVDYHPYEYLTYLLDVVEQGMKKAETLPEAEAAVLKVRLQRVKLTPLYMLLINSLYYYDRNPVGKQAVIDEFFGICDELGVVYYGERYSIASLRELYAS